MATKTETITTVTCDQCKGVIPNHNGDNPDDVPIRVKKLILLDRCGAESESIEDAEYCGPDCAGAAIEELHHAINR